MKLERRTFTFNIEERDDAKPMIRGHAALFNVDADLGPFIERIMPGAFASAIGRDDVRALWNHNPDHVLGRSTSGTLTMSEDDRGLAVAIDPPDTQLARDLMVSMKRGDVTQMSFGFQVMRGGSDWTVEGNRDVRIITAVRLFDVSPVTYPAYTQTDVGVRSVEEIRSDRPAAEPRRDPVGETQVQLYLAKLRLAAAL
jgi:uncharacterized protein